MSELYQNFNFKDTSHFLAEWRETPAPQIRHLNSSDCEHPYMARLNPWGPFLICSYPSDQFYGLERRRAVKLPPPLRVQHFDFRTIRSGKTTLPALSPMFFLHGRHSIAISITIATLCELMSHSAIRSYRSHLASNAALCPHGYSNDAFNVGGGKVPVLNSISSTLFHVCSSSTTSFVSAIT